MKLAARRGVGARTVADILQRIFIKLPKKPRVQLERTESEMAAILEAHMWTTSARPIQSFPSAHRGRPMEWATTSGIE